MCDFIFFGKDYQSYSIIMSLLWDFIGGMNIVSWVFIYIANVE